VVIIIAQWQNQIAICNIIEAKSKAYDCAM